MMNLKANNVSFAYHKKRPILKDVSLSLDSNQIIGLIGDSGSGKSTLCKIMAGYISNFTGEVTMDNKKIPEKWIIVLLSYIFDLGYNTRLSITRRALPVLRSMPLGSTRRTLKPRPMTLRSSDSSFFCKPTIVAISSVK